jgi:hypothetical protein
MMAARNFDWTVEPMKRNSPHTQHAALGGGIAALASCRVQRVAGMRSLLATVNLLPQISARF